VRARRTRQPEVILSPRNFAVTGVAGFVAPRHLHAIAESGHAIVAAVDPHDAAGILDRYAFDVRFFTDFEAFDRHLACRQRGPETGRVHVLTVCAPNDLHAAHIGCGLRHGADVICEKPLVVDPRELDAIQRLEDDTGRRVVTVLQLRLHPALVALKERLTAGGGHHDVDLSYVTARGPWYDVSWKGQANRSGGIAMNIGIHLFDLLLWLFGDVRVFDVHHADPKRMAGTLELTRATARWFLSTSADDLPVASAARGAVSFRSIVVDGEAIEFTGGITDLHTRVYDEALNGRGPGIADARRSIELVDRIRTTAARVARTLSPTLSIPR
jgi:UDP-N-acetyl-2-amino-2-deoxyglucuronate dehydrogenase